MHWAANHRTGNQVKTSDTGFHKAPHSYPRLPFALDRWRELTCAFQDRHHPSTFRKPRRQRFLLYYRFLSSHSIIANCFNCFCVLSDRRASMRSSGMWSCDSYIEAGIQPCSRVQNRGFDEGSWVSQDLDLKEPMITCIAINMQFQNDFTFGALIWASQISASRGDSPTISWLLPAHELLRGWSVAMRYGWNPNRLCVSMHPIHCRHPCSAWAAHVQMGWKLWWKCVLDGKVHLWHMKPVIHDGSLCNMSFTVINVCNRQTCFLLFPVSTKTGLWYELTSKFISFFTAQNHILHTHIANFMKFHEVSWRAARGEIMRNLSHVHYS